MVENVYLVDVEVFGVSGELEILDGVDVGIEIYCFDVGVVDDDWVGLFVVVGDV